MKGKSKFWGKQLTVSMKQIDFCLNLIEFRKENKLSLKEMADLCNLYGEPHGIKFYGNEIYDYECLKHAPRIAKYEILSRVLNSNIEFQKI